MTQTSPRDQVLDGWSGMGVFRPHTFYYYFLHPEVRAMVAEQDWQKLMSGLKSGRIKPKVIVLDKHLEGDGLRALYCIVKYNLGGSNTAPLSRPTHLVTAVKESTLDGS